MVNVTSSGSEHGNWFPHKVVGRSEDGYCYTNNVPNSWMVIDIGDTRRLIVGHYCIRHGNDSLGHALRNWDFQGSLDNSTWTTLKSHVNDQPLAATGYSVAHWPVDHIQSPFRYFRLYSTGLDSSSRNFTVCGGLELWGLLQEQ